MQIPRVSKIPKIHKNLPQGLDFWKLEEFARFLDFEAPARVSKNPKLGLEFLEFWNFGNSRNFLKIQKSSKFLEFPKFQKSKKIHPKVGNLGNSRNLLDFWILRLPLEFPKIQTLGWVFFGFLEFWKLEEFPQNLKIEQIPRVSKIPKTQKNPPQGWEFWKLEEFARFLDFEAPARVSKNPNLGVGFLGILETRGICSKSKNRANSSSFQNSKKPKNPPQGWGFWKLEEFARFLDFEAPARVSKNPNLGVDFFLDFWNFGNSRNLPDFWILRLPLEFPKIQTLGWVFWIFGILETRGICSIFGF